MSNMDITDNSDAVRDALEQARILCQGACRAARTEGKPDANRDHGAAAKQH